MTDRLPGAPGQYRALITPAELEKLQSGEGFTITLTRDDRPVIEGTPYNKEAVLPDELAVQICPDVDDPSPADAFRGLLTQLAADNLAPKLAAVYTWEQWEAEATVQELTDAVILSGTGAGSYEYADAVGWNGTGWGLIDPVSAEYSAIAVAAVSIQNNGKGRYIRTNSGVFYLPAEVSTSLDMNQSALIADVCTGYTAPKRLNILASEDPDAYPNEGELDGYYYIASRQRGAEKSHTAPVYLTQEEYDALAAAGQVNSTTPYLIIQGDGG